MKRQVLALALAAAWLLAGCGYSAGLKLPPGSRSMAIEIFGNDGPEPNVERELHRQMTRSARNLITGELVRPSEADVIVRGRISNYSRRGGLRTGGNQLRETGLVIRIEAWLVSEGGRPLNRRAVKFVDVGYLTGVLGAEEDALSRALKNLSDGLLLQLFGPPSKVDEPEIEEPAFEVPIE